MKVTGVKSTLNIRQEASTQSPVVGKIENGQLVEFIRECEPEWSAETGEDWYQIRYNGKEGWVLAKYLDFTEEEPQENASGSPDTHESILSKMNGFTLGWSRLGKAWMAQALVGTAVVALLIFRIWGEDEEEFAGIVSIIFSISVLVYIAYTGDNSLWFIDPDRCGGIGWAILHGVLFLFVVLVKIWGTKFTKALIEYEGRSLMIGVVAVPLLFGGLLFCRFKCPEYSHLVFYAFLVTLIAETAFIAIKGDRIGAFAYITEILAITLLLMPALILAVIIVAFVCILGIVLFIWDKMDDSGNHSPVCG